MRGPKPIPTDLQLARHRRIKRPNPAEPKHAAIDVGTDPPDELTDDRARDEWRRVIDTLSRGHVTTVDRPTLIAYCSLWARWRALETAAALQPFTTSAPSGYTVPNALIGMANKTLVLMLKAAAELGLTPSSRSRVQQAAFEEPKRGTPVDEFTAWQRKRRSGR